MRYSFPNEPTLTQIGRDLILDLNQENPVFDYIFPIVERREIAVRWFQDENVGGLMKLRGAGGAPTPVQMPGRQFFETEPAVFGEYATIDEIELMKLGRGVPKSNTMIAIDVADRVDQIQTVLRTRLYNRMRQMAWTLARLGTLTLYVPSGGVGYEEQFTVRSRTVPILWTNRNTATPLLDLQAQHQLYGIGTSYNYGYTSVVIMNTYTSNLLFNNNNASDWGGKKGANGQTLQSMGAYDVIRVDMMLPKIIIWDGGYLDEDGTTWIMDIPNGEVMHVAVRPDGERPGEFQMTYNAVNEDTGVYSYAREYRGNDPKRETPPRIDVEMGFNGGIAAHHILQWTRLIVASG